MYKLIGILFIVFCHVVFAEPLELYWEDMVPKNYVIPDTPLNHEDTMQQLNLDAPVVKELNGKLVKIPGFIALRHPLSLYCCL